MTITLGASAGWHQYGRADVRVSRHATMTRSDGTVLHGYYVLRRRLVDRQAFEYDPRLGWEINRWFEWVEPLDVAE